MVAVLLDTDIGSDIDDAVALAYLLARDDCEIVGITTVSGRTAQRAACARAICAAAGRPEIPVVAGLREPLLTGAGQPEVPQYPAVEHLERSGPEAGGAAAVDFLRTTVRERPGEVVLLTVGPLTNVAACFAADPEVPSLLGGMVSMAGDFRAGGIVEWNVRVDPVAAAVALARAPAGHLCVGLDVTTEVRMPQDDVRRRFAGHPTLEVVLAMAGAWFEHADSIVFHDPLAAALVFGPHICGVEEAGVSVEIAGPPDTWGRTVADPEGGHHRVARTVDPDAFFTEYFGVFGR